MQDKRPESEKPKDRPPWLHSQGVGGIGPPSIPQGTASLQDTSADATEEGGAERAGKQRKGDRGSRAEGARAKRTDECVTSSRGDVEADAPRELPLFKTAGGAGSGQGGKHGMRAGPAGPAEEGREPRVHDAAPRRRSRKFLTMQKRWGADLEGQDPEQFVATELKAALVDFLRFCVRGMARFWGNVGAAGPDLMARVTAIVTVAVAVAVAVAGI